MATLGQLYQFTFCKQIRDVLSGFPIAHFAFCALAPLKVSIPPLHAFLHPRILHNLHNLEIGTVKVQSVSYSASNSVFKALVATFSLAFKGRRGTLQDRRDLL